MSQTKEMVTIIITCGYCGDTFEMQVPKGEEKLWMDDQICPDCSVEFKDK